MAKYSFDQGGPPPQTYIDGAWHEGNVPLMSSMTHAAWLGSTVFDGARAFEGVAPDLDLHCQRLIHSAHALGLKPTHSAEEVEEIVREGIAKFPSGTPLYLRPMYWGETGFVAPDPESTRFAIVISYSAMPEPTGFSAMLSNVIRPGHLMAPSEAKAACHYPNLARALTAARKQGYDNAVVLDPLGHVAEFSTSNIWMAKDGVLSTPAANGCFLAGITRNRVIRLFAEKGVQVQQRAIRPEELDQADEIFNTGNYGKVMPCTRYNGREMQPGPFYRQARDMYWEWSHR